MSERLTDNSTLFRLRVRYGKRDRLKYLGHLELIHTIERIVRRAGLPYAVTQGFSPHMRVGFSSALPVGTSSTCEWYDLFMTEFIALDEAFERLAAASPADLAPIEAAYIDVRTPALTAQLTRLSYRIDLHLDPEAPVSADEMRAAIDTLRAGHGIDYARAAKRASDLIWTIRSLAMSSRRGSVRTIWCSCSTPMPTTRAPCVRRFCFLLLMFCCRA